MRNNGRGRQITMGVRKMREELKKIGFGLVAVGLCLALLASVTIPQVALGEPAGKERVVKIGNRACLSGALATTTVPACLGFHDGIRGINDKGGIDGVEIDLLWQDTRALVPNAISIHKRFAAAGVVLELEPISTLAETTAPAQVRDEIPLIWYAELTRGMITEPIRWLFSYLVGFGPEFATFMKWVKENWTEERPPRIGLMFYDHASGWDNTTAIPVANELGVEFVGYEVIPLLGAIDTSVEWLRLVGKNADWVYCGICGASLVTAVKDAYRLGIQQKGIKLATWAPGLDEFIVRTTGEDAAEGWYISKPHPPAYVKGVPGVDEAMELAKRYRGWGPERASGHYVAGYALARISGEVIRKAIAEVGYENLTGCAVRDAIVSLREFDMGGIVPYASCSEDAPYLIPFLRYYHIEQGKMVPISKHIKFDKTYDYKELGGKL